MMKRFGIKILFFIIPLVLALIPPMFFILSTGENFKSIDNLIIKKKPFLIGYAFNEQNYKYLKWKTIVSHNKYEVMALGSSRVLSFNNKMFSSSFYNAGYTISSINDFIPFLKSFPEDKLPSYLILGLDQWMFNNAWDNLQFAPTTENWSKSFKNKPNANTIISVWEDIINNKYVFKNRPAHDIITRVGINSSYNNSGFRNDGSFYYGGQIQKLLNKDETANDHNYENTLERIKNGNQLFEYGNSINNNAIIELQRILEFCKKYHIKVVAFLPPFANKVNNELRRSGKYDYMNLIYPSATQLFEKYRNEFYDFSLLETSDSNDSETIDGFHGGEVTYLKILISMLESKSVLNKVSNIDRLKLELKNSKNRLEVY